MLSMQSVDLSSTTTSTVRIKTLDTATLRTDDQKDLEEESEDLQPEEPANNEQVEEQQEESSVSQESQSLEEEEEATSSGLSVRADEIKLFLREESTVKALCLKSDGSTQEIAYSTSSSATRQLLSGRPSIVGEIEDLQLVVVQCLERSSGSSLNQHTLPVPLCHNQSGGDYLVFRVDAEGKAADVSLKEYSEYVEEHKTLTATALKQYSSDALRIKSNSPFASSSGNLVLCR